ncbi:MAG: amidohydrolase family protein [Victivallales bacterium]|nr:amidohydrolase family protein [Victivallales bacterium]
MIIDIHTHIANRATFPSMLAEDRRNGVVLNVVSCLGLRGWPSYPTAEVVREANELSREFAASAPGHVLWFCYLNPQLPNWRAELALCLTQGIAGIKLWTALRDPAGSSHACDAVAEAASQEDLPVLIHTWNRTDDNLPGEFDSAAFASLARRHPNTRFVAAHAGANWRQARGLYADLPNVWVDICGGYPQRGMVEDLVAELGPERVLYGSDALGRSFASQIAKVEFADVPTDVRERVLWRNAAELLQLDEAALARARKAFAALPVPAEVLPIPDLAVDHFCYSGRWPFRTDLPGTNPVELDVELAAVGCAYAYVADADGIFAYDTMAANDRFAATAAGLDRVRPLATLTPFAPNWRVQVAHVAERFAGAVVHPYFHDWRLDDPALTEFWRACAEAGLPLWVNLCTEDWRLRLRGSSPHQTTAAELLAFLVDAPPSQYVFQGAALPLVSAALAGNDRQDIAFEISRLSDNTAALPSICRQHGVDRLVLGSEYPFRDLRTVRWTTEFLCGICTASKERQ